MIRGFLDALAAAGLDLSAEDAADALWLALHLEKPDPAAIVEEREREDGTAPADPIEAKPEIAPPPEAPPAHQEAPGPVRIHSPSPAGAGTDRPMRRGRTVESPGVPALPGALGIARALRPLKRRVPSRTRFVLDEEATVVRIAEGGPKVPVLKPAPERWLDLALVVDGSPTLVLWRQTIAELRLLLERHGAFRDVRTWRLTAEEGKIRLHPGWGTAQPTGGTRSPRELVDPEGRRLILVVSDCVSEAWHSGQMTNEALAVWGNSGPLALIQVLPPRLWTRTGLDSAEDARLSASLPGAPNHRLQVLGRWNRWRPVRAGELALPIVTLEPGPVAAWSRLLGGMSGSGQPGKIFDRKAMPLEESEEETAAGAAEEELPTAAERVQDFRSGASPLARRLAGYLAAAPLSVPVMRLVQAVMLPESRQVHLAEVFLGGLLKQITPEGMVRPEEIQYEFEDGVRDLLLNEVRTHETVRVIEEISAWLERQTGVKYGFTAVIEDSEAADGVIVDDHSRPFAEVTASVLRRLGGGRFGKAAERLEEKLGVGGQPPPRASQAKRKRALNGTRVVYQDFVLKIDAAPNGTWSAKVLESPAGQGTVRLELPFKTGEIRELYRDAEDAEGARDLRVTSPSRDTDIGEILFRALFHGPVYSLLERSLGRIENDPEAGLCIRLVFGMEPAVAEMASLPWELLYWKERREFLCLNRKHPLVRSLLVPRPVRPWPDGPLRVLAVTSNPRGTRPLSLEKEIKALMGIEGIDVRWLDRPTPAALHARLLQEDFDVLHFSGHAQYNPQSGEGSLLFQDDQGRPVRLSGHALADVSRNAPSLRLAFLNASNTALFGDGKDPLGGTAAAFVMAGVPAILAMRGPISDRVALLFSRAVYERLATGDSIEGAVVGGRLALRLHEIDSMEWASPVLLMGHAVPAEPKAEVLHPSPTLSNIFALEALQAKHGDALLLHFGSPDKPHLILIDGGPPGTYRQVLRPRLEELRGLRNPDEALLIDLVIVSHMDDPQSRGILDLLTELSEWHQDLRPPLFKVRNLWCNSAPEASVLSLESLPRQSQLVDLAKQLRISINQPFEEWVSSGSSVEPIRFDPDLRLQVLGPIQKNVDRLKKSFEKALKQPPSKGLQGLSPANLASIVLLAESQGRRILLTGDARGDDILEGLAEAGLLDESGGVHVDVLKLPHQGSAQNVSIDFFRRVTADHYLISGYGRNARPPGGLDMLLEARRGEPFTLHFTYPMDSLLSRSHRQQAASGKFEVRIPASGTSSVRIDLA